MNNGNSFVLYRGVYMALLIVIFIALTLYMSFSEQIQLERLFQFFKQHNSLLYIYIFGFCTVVLSILFAIYYETYLNSKEKKEQLEQYSILEDEIEFYGQQIPYKVINSFFCTNVREYCLNAWNQGNHKSYITNSRLYCELLGYAYRMRDENVTVSWREEQLYLNKMLDLMKLCGSTSNVKIDLFENSSNYRFPIGLFVIPLFNAIECSLNAENSYLKIDCFSIGGYWNCKIGNNFVEHDEVNKKLTYQGFNTLKKKVDEGNWPIQLGIDKVDKGIEVFISGKYAS